MAAQSPQPGGDTTGDPQIAAFHRGVAAESRDAIIHLLAREAGPEDRIALEMLWELVRAALQGLALWWYEHRDVPREQVVAAAMNAIWVGLERTSAGERWTGSTVGGMGTPIDSRSAARSSRGQ